MNIHKICRDNGVFDLMSDEYQILLQKIHKNISDIFNDFCLSYAYNDVEISITLYPDSTIKIILYLDYIGATVEKTITKKYRYVDAEEYTLKVNGYKFTMSDMISLNDIFKEFCELLRSNLDLIVQYSNTHRMIFENYNYYENIYVKYYKDISKTINEDELIRLIKLDAIIK